MLATNQMLATKDVGNKTDVATKQMLQQNRCWHQNRCWQQNRCWNVQIINRFAFVVSFSESCSYVQINIIKHPMKITWVCMSCCPLVFQTPTNLKLLCNEAWVILAQPLIAIGRNFGSVPMDSHRLFYLKLFWHTNTATNDLVLYGKIVVIKVVQLGKKIQHYSINIILDKNIKYK